MMTYAIQTLGLGDAKTMADIAKFHAELPLLDATNLEWMTDSI
ncbi:MAG TPA: hypothetical protein VIS99_11225 [Terrimicrobiaceae bacterium]